MKHRGRVSARSSSLPSRGGSDSSVERIRHFRSDDDTPEAARALIVRELRALPEGGLLEIELGFDPTGLLGELAELGAQGRIQKAARGRWLLLLQPRDERELMDLCDLEAPLPMERVLEMVAKLGPGETLIARTPCFPRPLLAQLERRGLDWEAAEAADESGLVWVGRRERG